MNKLGIIIEREYLSRVKKKSFIIMTLLMPLIFVAIIAVPLLLSTVSDNKQRQIAVNDESGLYMSRLQNSDHWNFVAFNEEISQMDASMRGSFDIFVSVKGNLSDTTGIVKFYSEKQVGMEVKNWVMEQFRQMAQNDKIASYNIPELEQILQDVRVNVRNESVIWSEDGAEKKTSSEISLIIGMVATMLIYIFIFAYGNSVMSGVVEEKSNRIVEIMVSSVKPFYLMMGKIIGIALVGLTQFFLWVVLIAVLGTVFVTASGMPMDALMNSDMLASMSAAELAQFHVNADVVDALQIVQSFDWGKILLWFVLYFLGGYMLYSSMFAAIGAAVDNNEDTSQFVMPIVFIILFGLYAGMYGAMNPEGPLLRWCSFIPFTSPIVMVVRLPFGVPIWELLISYALLAATFILTVKLAAKIYRTGILLYGKKITYKDLLIWLRLKN